MEFFSYDKLIIETWIKHLKQQTILINLRDYYKVENAIGKGNFARVHKCQRIEDNHTMAIKSVLNKTIKQSERNQRSILLEIDIMRKLKHPNVVDMFEVFESDKYVHLVMEILLGGELFERIKQKGSYSEKDAMMVMKRFLEALDFLHKAGIVHRDLKPENLLLKSTDCDYELKIADFGLACFIEEGELLDLRCGSPGYVAPELLSDEGYNTKADIFSAGVILYILLTGRPAFAGAKYQEILMKNKECDIKYPVRYWDKISKEAQDLVK